MSTEILSIATDGSESPVNGDNFFYVHNQYERKIMKIKSLHVQNQDVTTATVLLQKVTQEETLTAPSDALVRDLITNKSASDFKIVAAQGADLEAAATWNSEDVFMVSILSGEEKEFALTDMEIPYNRGFTIQNQSGAAIALSVRCVVELIDID